MKIQEAEIHNFRNILKTHLNFNNRLNLFIGLNGQGKTNLIESVYLTLNNKSFRPSLKEHFINNQNQTHSSIKLKIKNNNLEDELELNILTNKSKTLCNKKNITKKRLIENYSTILFSPESLVSIKGSSESRRSLVKEILYNCSKKNIVDELDWEEVFKTRGKLLKNNKEKKLKDKEFIDVYESLTQIYLQKSVNLTIARINILKELNPIIEGILNQIETNKKEVSIEYLASGEKINHINQEELYVAMQKRQKELAIAEIESGFNLVGPHKHDIRILQNGMDSRFLCSQGQQRALIVSIKLSQIVHHNNLYGTKPILLLDDVMSELDENKRAYLLNYLRSHDVQTFLTTTDKEDIKQSDEITAFRVELGQFSEERL